MRLLASFALAFGALIASWTATAAPVPQNDEAKSFIVGNTVFTLYHELGHALVHELDLPVLGREEDAVDNLATILMIPDDDQPELLEPLLGAARGWMLAHQMQQQEGEEMAFWDEHGLDMQRYYSIVCLLYGSDPDSFEELADAAELPDYRRESCSGNYEQVVQSWATVLDPYFAEDNKGGAKVNVRFAAPPRNYRHLAQILKESHVVTDIAKEIQTSFKLPRQLTVKVDTCDGDANAFFDPEDHSVTVCYELVEMFADMSEMDLESDDEE
ncbi:MAG TPA: DUF4344 domain-containing metallopeptidase [Magnetospirillum sp.]|nr:DUF4344 domain-containing metallopeptidase [Magnetospirillum sp.]